MATLTMMEQTDVPKPHMQVVEGPHDLSTETSNIASEGFDTKSALEIARIVNHEDA